MRTNPELKFAAHRIAVVGALTLSALWALCAMRHTVVALFAVLLLSVVLLPLHKRWLLVASTWILFIVAALVPIDIRFDGELGLRPRVLPIHWGLLSLQGRALVREGKAWEGGCVMPTLAPKWVLAL